LARLMRGDPHNYLNLASDYAGCGLYGEAIAVLATIVPDAGAKAYPMLHYTLGNLYEREGDSGSATAHRRAGNAAAPDYCFPNSLFELGVLQSAIEADPRDDKAHYYLGNLLYDKKRHRDAIGHWEQSASINAEFATVHRNLALAYYNKQDDSEKALASLEKAFSLRQDDARVFYELDQLYKKLGYEDSARLGNLERHKALVEKRDDLYVEYVTLLNAQERYEEAMQALASRRFHPWEGGEGKVTGQHVASRIEQAKRELDAGRFEQAITHLEEALVYPENLGEGKLAGAQENHAYYYLGCAYEGLNERERAKDHFLAASKGLEEPTSAMYYNDQPPDMIFYQGLAWRKLGNEKEANRRFNKLIDYAEKNMNKEIKFDYFAVSLPDFLVFEDDMNKRNVIHCRYMMGLGLIGKRNFEDAKAQFDAVLGMDPSHRGASVHRKMCK